MKFIGKIETQFNVINVLPNMNQYSPNYMGKQDWMNLAWVKRKEMNIIAKSLCGVAVIDLYPNLKIHKNIRFARKIDLRRSGNYDIWLSTKKRVTIITYQTIVNL